MGYYLIVDIDCFLIHNKWYVDFFYKIFPLATAVAFPGGEIAPPFLLALLLLLDPLWLWDVLFKNNDDSLNIFGTNINPSIAILVTNTINDIQINLANDDDE